MYVYAILTSETNGRFAAYHTGKTLAPLVVFYRIHYMILSLWKPLALAEGGKSDSVATKTLLSYNNKGRVKFLILPKIVIGVNLSASNK